MPSLNVNTDAAVKLTRKLERMHRSDFPLAVRGTLNSAAFDVKQSTMPASARRNFVQRKANFFKATSRTKKAEGFHVNAMSAMTGFQGNQQAVRDLEEQEFGGKIEGRSFIPMDPARISGNPNKTIRANARLSRIKLQDARKGKTRGRNRQERFVKAAVKAGKGGFVIGNFSPSILWRIDNIRRDGRNMKIRKTPLYTFEKGRSVRVQRTAFMSEAARKTAAKLPSFYEKEAKRRFEKALRQ